MSDVERARELYDAAKAAWNAHVAANERTNAAIPSLEATRAEREVYDERYRISEQAKRDTHIASQVFIRFAAEHDIPLAALSLARPAPDEGVSVYRTDRDRQWHQLCVELLRIINEQGYSMIDALGRAALEAGAKIESLAKAPVSEDGWQSIETAPKDGTPFLIFVPDDMFRPETGQDVVWHDNGEWLYGDNSPFVPMNGPTHWRPLPAPPTTERGDG